MQRAKYEEEDIRGIWVVVQDTEFITETIHNTTALKISRVSLRPLRKCGLYMGREEDYMVVSVGSRIKNSCRYVLGLNFDINPSAWGHLNPSSYCDVGRLFYGVFKLWSKLQRKK